MDVEAATVIRRDETCNDGVCALPVGSTPANAPSAQAPPVTAPQVRIAQKQQSCAVLEVTCSCGRKSYIKCEYA